MSGIGLELNLKQVENMGMYQTWWHGLETRFEGQAVSAAVPSKPTHAPRIRVGDTAGV